MRRFPYTIKVVKTGEAYQDDNGDFQQGADQTILECECNRVMDKGTIEHKAVNGVVFIPSCLVLLPAEVTQDTLSQTLGCDAQVKDETGTVVIEMPVRDYYRSGQSGEYGKLWL
jgi:hypothetical protein